MSRSHVHVLVVGAGPAGLAAARAAAARGRRVLVLDQAPRPGGQIWRHRDAAELPAEARAALAAATSSGAVIASGASVIDVDGPTTVIVDFAGRVDRVSADAVVLATGAVERLVPFPGWTLPGVAGVGGLQALLKGGLPLRGQRVVLSGTGPLLYPVAASLVRAGAIVAAVLEQQRFSTVARFGITACRDPRKALDAVRYRLATRTVPWHHDAWIMSAHGAGRVEEVRLRIGTRETVVACDWVGAAAGLVPRTDLARLMGCALDGEAIAVDALQRTSCAGVFAAGECTGVKGDAAGMVEGAIAGAAAAGDEAPARQLVGRRARGIAFGDLLAHTFAPREELAARATAETVLCRCEDVPIGTIDPAWTARQAKLWTRVGMGACQGAVCGTACTSLYGWEPPVLRAPLGTPRLGAWSAQLTPPSDAPDA